MMSSIVCVCGSRVKGVTVMHHTIQMLMRWIRRVFRCAVRTDGSQTTPTRPHRSKGTMRMILLLPAVVDNLRSINALLVISFDYEAKIHAAAAHDS